MVLRNELRFLSIWVSPVFKKKLIAGTLYWPIWDTTRTCNGACCCCCSKSQGPRPASTHKTCCCS